MNIEEIADQIPSLWDTLDSLTQRVDILKNTLPLRGQYFNQILEAGEAVRCCTCCVILPDEKCSCDCGGDDPCKDATVLLRITPDLMYRIDDSINPEQPQPEMPTLMMGPITSELAILWQVEVDGVLYPTQVGYQGGDGEDWLYMEEYLEQNKETLGITGEFSGGDGPNSPDSGLSIRNIGPTQKKVRFIPNKTYPNTFMQFSENPSVSVDATTGIISFCLAAISNQISCDGALNKTEWIDISGDWKLEIDGVLVRPDATNIDDVITYLNETGFEVEIEDIPQRSPTDTFVINTKTNPDYVLLNNHNEVIDFDTGKIYRVTDGTGSFGDTQQMIDDGITLTTNGRFTPNGLVFDYEIRNHTPSIKHLGFGFKPKEQDRWINQNSDGNELVIFDEVTGNWDAFLQPYVPPL